MHSSPRSPAATLEKPRPAHKRRALRIGAAILLLAVAGFVLWGSLTPRPPSLGAGVSDKVQHFVAYFALALLAFAAWGRRSLRVGLAVLTFGLLIEVLQGLEHVGRSASALDGLADAGGVALAWLLWPRRR